MSAAPLDARSVRAAPGTLQGLLASARLHAQVGLRPQRMALPLLLAALAAGGAVVIRIFSSTPLAAFDDLVRWVLLLGLPAAGGLILGAGAWGLEVEGRTLTYLLLRPVPRGALYAGKLLAVGVAVAGLGLVALGAGFAVVWGTSSPPSWSLGVETLLRAAVAVTLASMAYTAMMGLVGVIVGSRAFTIGALYLVAVELSLGASDLALRWAAMYFHVRNVAGQVTAGSSAWISVLVIGGVTIVAVAAGSWVAGFREHRTKGAAA